MACSDSGTTVSLLTAIQRGDAGAIDQLLANHRDYLKRMIDVRLDPQLRGRIDPSDVVQETLVVASHRIKDFLTRRPTSFRIWLRRKALEQLIDQRRFHRRQKRNVRNEVVISDASSFAIAEALVDSSVGRRAMRQELLDQIRVAMGELSESDREVLLLRHAEELSNAETAEIMGIESKAASARYGRAVLRLSGRLRRRGVTSD